MEVDNSRFETPVTYIFNKSNNDILENIVFIFIFLKNYTLFVDDFLPAIFMEDIYLKNWHNLSLHIFNFNLQTRTIYFNFKPIIETNGIKFLKLTEMCEYLIENVKF